MKKIKIYEPAMCCPTGLCGVVIDPELLRISTVLDRLAKNNVHIERFNLSSAPMEFIKNNEINKVVGVEGVEVLPITVVDDEIILKGRYPKNEEFMQMLNLPLEFLHA